MASKIITDGEICLNAGPKLCKPPLLSSEAPVACSRALDRQQPAYLTGFRVSALQPSAFVHVQQVLPAPFAGFRCEQQQMLRDLEYSETALVSVSIIIPNIEGPTAEASQ